MRFAGTGALAAKTALAQPPAPDALADAALRGDVATATKLLNAGADPNASDADGATPLMYAVSATARRRSADFLGMAKLLLAHGADVNRKDLKSRTAFLEATVSRASENGIIPVSEPLLELLLAAGADINAPALDGVTALHQVAGQWASQPRTVRMLLARGARLNQPDEEGRTPLMFAAMNGRTEIVNLLCARGASAIPEAKPRST